VSLHFHGTPLSPRSSLLAMAGKCLCVPFSDARDAEWALAHAQAVMWDNGAFSLFRNGGTALDIPAYYTWLEPLLGHPHFAIPPDRIDGDAAEQAEMLNTWPFSKAYGAPVWHIGLPIGWLLDLVDEWPKVCFGSSGQYWQIGSDAWCRRMDEAFNVLARNGPMPWVHGLRMAALNGDRWPMASTDSANVARNFKDYNVCPERMARRLDAIQNPIKWELAPEQMGLFANEQA
jgi:hypothetical protein